MIDHVCLCRMAQSRGVVNQNDERSINEITYPNLDAIAYVRSAVVDQVQIDNAHSSDTSSSNQISPSNSSSRKQVKSLD